MEVNPKENMKIWDKLKNPPESALKPIKGGRLSGFTDINPQWRMEAMTELFGPCGIGWRYTIADRWTEAGGDGELMCFIQIQLYFKLNGEWSSPVEGLGGSTLVAKEKGGLYSSDEAYKMALTDALSVAMKTIGVAATIYMGDKVKGNASKYDKTPASQPSSGANTGNALTLKQLGMIKYQLQQKKLTEASALEGVNIDPSTKLQSLSSKQASGLIEYLMNFKHLEDRSM